MVNLHSPLLSAEFGPAFFILWHVMSGIYYWEFFTTLDYEWRVFRGHLPHRYTIWIYSLTRVVGLLAVILCTFGLDETTPINCQLWVTFMAIAYCLSLATASLLIVLRIIAIWNRNKAVMATSIIIWVVGLGFHIHAIVRIRAIWNPLVLKCLYVSEKRVFGITGAIPAIFADLSLIVIMLFGLLLLRRHGGGIYGLTPILWRQAVIWLSLAVVCEAPPVVIAALSMDDQNFVNMLLVPILIIMTITSTRMHRSLVDYASGFPDVVSKQGNGKLPINRAISLKTKRAQAALNSSDRIEVNVHTAFEQHTTTNTNDYDSYNATNEQVHEKPSAWGLDGDVERGL